MKLKINYLLVCFLMVLAFAKCKKSLTQATGSTQSKIEAPSLIAPATNSNQSTSLILKWSGIEGADSYQIKLSESKTFDYAILDSLVPTNKLTVQGLPSDTTVHWKVHPVIQGKQTSWSDSWSFKTSAAADSGDVSAGNTSTPEQVAPGNKEKDVAIYPEFEWTNIDGTESYSLHVSHDDQMIIKQKVDDTTFVPNSPLDTETTYYWRVKSVTGKWSDIHSFTTTDTPSEPLPAPTQVAPANEQEKVALKPVFKWKSVGQADAYTLHVTHGDQMVIEQQVDSPSFITDEALAVNTTYYWRVQAVNGEWSDIHSFTTTDTASEPLPAPTQVAPANEQEEVALKPVFKWESVDQADAYTLHVTHGDQMVIEQQVDSPSFKTDEALVVNTTYYWRVRPVNGEWSDIHSFTTKDTKTKPLPAPKQVVPANNAKDITLNPEFSWKGIEVAENYTLVIKRGDKIVIEKKLEETSFTPEQEFKEETIYSWKVKAGNEVAEGEWSKIHTFTTAKIPREPLQSPEQVSPVNEEENVALKPVFKWKSVEQADAYEVHVSHGEDMVIKQQVEGSGFAPDKELAADATFYWRVRAIEVGTKGNWSDIHSFTTAVGEIDTVFTNLELPKDNVKNRPAIVELQWQAVPGASEYKVQLADGEQFKSLVVDKSVEATSYEVSELDYNEDYAWRVEPVVSGEETTWSDIYTFSTRTPAVKLISPHDGASDQSTQLALKWQSLDGVGDYRVQVAAGNSFGSPLVDETIGDTSFEVSGLKYQQRFYWRVRAEGGEWSDIYGFTTKQEQSSNPPPPDEDEQEDEDDGGAQAGTERQALMALYASAGGELWSNNAGWGQGEPSNNWHGIQVDGQGRVTRIDLYKNGLTGVLPESIGDLSHVEYLNVKGNKLAGPIPESIGDMQALKTLILSGRTYEIGGNVKQPPSNLDYGYHPGKYSSSTNRFTGRIPGSIGGLSKLEFLEISDQPGITGPLPSELGNLSRLKGMYLNSLAVAGFEIPRSFKNLTELRHLYLSNNNWVGSLPDMSKMTKLTWVTITSTETLGKGLTGTLPDMRNLHNLRGLFLNNNELEGPYPTYFNSGNFSELHTIGFSWNNLTGELGRLNNLPKLESLTLSGNEMTGSIKQAMLDLPQRVQIFSVGWNNFSGEIPQSGYADFNRLKTLYMNDNKLSGAISCEFWNKLDNPKLIFAWLKNNNFTSNCTSAMNAVRGEGDRLSITVGGNNF